MKKTFSQKKSAFSLIELSIVLIIIGLLIAGVTGGASLIKSSELRSIMGEARAYATSINGFYTQFNYLPGDYAVAIGASCVGDADGKIEFNTACVTGAGGEGSNAWAQMLNAKVIDTNVILAAGGTPQVDSAAISTFGTYAPASKVKASGWALDYRLSGTASTAFANEAAASAQNVIVLTGAIAAGTAGTNNLLGNTTAGKSSVAIMATDALSIDAKIDDSNAGTGKVRGVSPTVVAIATAADASGATNCYYYADSAFTYNTTDTVKSCGLSYQVDVNS
jgi:prepilin-type N-terminal cleavage/methylation domain-containing protein